MCQQVCQHQTSFPLLSGDRGGYGGPPQVQMPRRAAGIPQFDLITEGETLAIRIDCEGLMLPQKDGSAPRCCGRVSIVTEDPWTILSLSSDLH